MLFCIVNALFSLTAVVSAQSWKTSEAYCSIDGRNIDCLKSENCSPHIDASACVISHEWVSKIEWLDMGNKQLGLAVSFSIKKDDIFDNFILNIEYPQQNFDLCVNSSILGLQSYTPDTLTYEIRDIRFFFHDDYTKDEVLIKLDKVIIRPKQSINCVHDEYKGYNANICLDENDPGYSQGKSSSIPLCQTPTTATDMKSWMSLPQLLAFVLSILLILILVIVIIVCVRRFDMIKDIWNKWRYRNTTDHVTGVDEVENLNVTCGDSSENRLSSAANHENSNSRNSQSTARYYTPVSKLRNDPMTLASKFNSTSSSFYVSDASSSARPHDYNNHNSPTFKYDNTKSSWQPNSYEETDEKFSIKASFFQFEEDGDNVVTSPSDDTTLH